MFSPALTTCVGITQAGGLFPISLALPPQGAIEAGRVGEGETNHVLTQRQSRPITGRTVVVAVAREHLPNAILFGQLDRPFHAIVPHHVPKTVIAVQHPPGQRASP